VYNPPPEHATLVKDHPTTNLLGKVYLKQVVRPCIRTIYKWLAEKTIKANIANRAYA